MIHIISPAFSQWNIKIHQHAAYAHCASSNGQSFLHGMTDVVITDEVFHTDLIPVLLGLCVRVNQKVHLKHQISIKV